MSSYKSKYRLSLLFLALSLAFVAFAQNMAPMSIKVKADSTTLTMGDRTTVNIEVLKNSHNGALVGLPPKGQDLGGIELSDLAADSADLGNGRVQLNYRLIFQVWNPSELLVISPFGYAVDGDTVMSEIVSLKVLPVELSPDLGDINDVDNLKVHPDELTQSIKPHFFDFLPDWTLWAILVIVAVTIIGVLIYVFFVQKKNGTGIFTRRRPLPPYQLAIKKLHQLKGKRLIENGLAKQFYTEVTDIWRQYLHGRFNIPAMEMTSRQILKELRHNKDTRLSELDLDRLLEISDFVKFAAMSPTREEMSSAYDTILRFVEATKPAEPENDDDQMAEVSADDVKK